MPRPPADTDSVSKAGAIVIPGSDLPVQVNLRLEGKTERDRNLRCNSVEAAQASALSGCNAGFLPPTLGFNGTIKSAGMVGDRVHVNVDYDMNREFDASQTVSLYYEGKPGERVQRVEVGNINFVPPASRFITSSLPSGNYGIQITNQFGPLRLKTIYAQQTGNVVQSRQFVIGGNGTGPGKSQQLTERETNDYQIDFSSRSTPRSSAERIRISIF
jgi:cell surface protein SprA